MREIVLQNIVKTYENGKVQAVRDLSLSIYESELFGLIGPDGAGKTSIFRILTTLLLPDSGSAFVNGFDVVKEYKQIRKEVGYMPGRFSLYQDLTVQENLTFFATVFNTSIAANYDLIKDIYVQIEPFKVRKAGKLSGGMKQKLALCCALIHRPSVLFLDEPTTGVDAVSRKEFWEMLQRLKKEGITIMVSTPYMDEANLCDRIALIQNGSLLSVETPQTITSQYNSNLFAVRSNQMSLLLKELKSIPYIQSCFGFGDYHHITFIENQDYSEQLIFDLQSKQMDSLEIKKIAPSIEDCFIKLMNP